MRTLTPKQRKQIYMRAYCKANSERLSQRANEWRIAHKDRQKSAVLAWMKKNEKKVEAHNILNRAVKSGKLKRGKCRDCASIRTHGHHTDYSKPLQVIWLCAKHHGIEHARLNEKNFIEKEIKGKNLKNTKGLVGAVQRVYS